MKKIIFFIFLLVAFFVFSNCKIPSLGKEDEVSGDVSSSVYKQITSSDSIMDVSPVSNRDTELYMFVYNTGDEKIGSDSYKDIFYGRARSAIDIDSVGGGIEPLCGEKYAHYSCGLSSERIRNAYKNFSIIDDNARAVDSNQYLDKTRNKKASNVGDETEFYKEYTEGKGKVSILSVKATCRFTNDDCQIFVENDCYDSSNSDKAYIKINDKKCKITQVGVEKMAAKFSSIYKAEQALLGEANLDNIESNNIIETSEKITIFIANLGIKDSGDITMGYFYPNDLRCDLSALDEYGNYSNQRMMFTLNVIEYGSTNGEHRLYSSMGHEFNHMINYITKSLIHKLSFETWFTEMLSAIVENFIPSYLEIEHVVEELRISFFNFGYYVGLVDWKNVEREIDILYSYGFTYAFGSYLVRNYGGADLVHKMATNKYYGKEAISAALKACGYNETFETVFLKFGLVMVNADGKNLDAPTLNKRIECKRDSYTYVFEPIDLYVFEQIASSNNMKYYRNPNWNSNNYKGPCFYYVSGIIHSYPKMLYGVSFYAIYLGKARDWGYKLSFNPPSENVQAYIYIRN